MERMECGSKYRIARSAGEPDGIEVKCKNNKFSVFVTETSIVLICTDCDDSHHIPLTPTKL